MRKPRKTPVVQQTHRYVRMPYPVCKTLFIVEVTFTYGGMTDNCEFEDSIDAHAKACHGRNNGSGYNFSNGARDVEYEFHMSSDAYAFEKQVMRNEHIRDRIVRVTLSTISTTRFRTPRVLCRRGSSAKGK